MKLVYAVLLVASSAAAEPPRVVTQAWLGEMNKAGWPLEEMVDRERGLVVLERRVDSPYCGAAIDREISVLRRYLRAEYAHSDTFHCQNKPSASCSFAFAYEYTYVTSLRFDKAADGTLRLTSVTILDGGSQGEEFVDEQARWVASQSRRLARKSCSATTQP